MLPTHPRVSCADSINESHLRCVRDASMLMPITVLLPHFLDSEVVQQSIKLALQAALLSMQVWPSPSEFLSDPVPGHGEVHSVVPPEDGFFLTVPKTWRSRTSHVIISHGMDWSGNSPPLRSVFPYVRKRSRVQLSSIYSGRPVRQHNSLRTISLGGRRRLLMTIAAQVPIVVVQDHVERHLVLTCALHCGAHGADRAHCVGRQPVRGRLPVFFSGGGDTIRMHISLYEQLLEGLHECCRATQQRSDGYE